VKIGPADLQIICLREITEGKIYSPVDRFAERAKQVSKLRFRCKKTANAPYDMPMDYHVWYAML